ncbi:MAG TPA: hypothetical protein VFB74_30655 [Kribbellaceae bacterium]|nr:hypothetical protein [Kribbellaceae bacterium]
MAEMVDRAEAEQAAYQAVMDVIMGYDVEDGLRPDELHDALIARGWVYQP